jgi:hypothetical protein
MNQALKGKMEMEQQTKQSNDSLTISQPAQKQSALLEWLVEQVTVLAEAMAEPMTTSRLKIYAGDLADIKHSQLEIAFTRARRELKFFPRIAELRELAGHGEKQQGDAEARAGWDELTKFVRKYVSNDVYGNFGPEHGWHAKSFPKLNDRILDCVRRTGGWKAYACMTNEDFPFQQQRFFAEFLAWKAVQQIPVERMLVAHDKPALPAAKQKSESEPQESAKADQISYVALKKIPEPLTDAQLQDRRTMLHQQTQFLRTRHNATQQGECSSVAR